MSRGKRHNKIGQIYEADVRILDIIEISDSSDDESTSRRSKGKGTKGPIVSSQSRLDTARVPETSVSHSNVIVGPPTGPHRTGATIATPTRPAHDRYGYLGNVPGPSHGHRMQTPLFLPSDEDITTPHRGPPSPAPTPRIVVDLDEEEFNAEAEILDLTLDDEIAVPNQAPKSNIDPLAQILEIIPAVLPSHVTKLFQNFVAQFPDDSDDAAVQRVLHALFDNPSFPKAEPQHGKRKRDAENNEGSDKRAKLEDRVDYKSTERLFKGGKDYKELAIAFLSETFPSLTITHIKRTFTRHKSFYAPAYLALEAEVDTSGSGAVRSVRRSKGKGKAKASMQDEEFERERLWIVELIADRNRSNEKGKGKVADAEVLDSEEIEDIECGCCFGEYGFSQIVQCPDAHLFCKSCVVTYASTQLGSHNIKLQCMSSSPQCTHLFGEAELRRVLPDKLFSLYERLVQQSELKKAFDGEGEADESGGGLEECPFCDWKCVMDVSLEVEKLFRCGNYDECGQVSCRRCKKIEHLPKSCEEVEEDKKLDGRHAVEEAMTKALMRNCPKCQKPFVKDFGCNKMMCPNCQTMSCYICRKAITSYNHFDQRGGGQSSRSTKCVLYDQGEQRHVQEVNEAAEAAKKKYKADHPDTEDKDLAVDPATVPNHPQSGMGFGLGGLLQFNGIPLQPPPVHVPLWNPYLPDWNAQPLAQVHPQPMQPQITIRERERVIGERRRAEREERYRRAREQIQARAADRMQTRAAAMATAKARAYNNPHHR